MPLGTSSAWTSPRPPSTFTSNASRTSTSFTAATTTTPPPPPHLPLLPLLPSGGGGGGGGGGSGAAAAAADARKKALVPALRSIHREVGCCGAARKRTQDFATDLGDALKSEAVFSSPPRTYYLGYWSPSGPVRNLGGYGLSSPRHQQPIVT